jgi:hypothetical protein
MSTNKQSLPGNKQKYIYKLQTLQPKKEKKKNSHEYQ